LSANWNPDTSEIDLRSRRGNMTGGLVYKANRTVRAGQSDSISARRGHCRDQAGVHAAGKHRDDDFERLVIGDTQSIDLLLRNARACECSVDVFPASVDDDERMVALKAGNRAANGKDSSRILEQFPSKLQDDRPRPNRSSRD